MKTHLRMNKANAITRARWDEGGGFTFVEVLVTLVLSIAVIGSVVSAYVSHQKSFLVATSFIDVQNDARKAMENMVRDGRWAVELVSSKGAYTTTPSCIVLKVPSINDDNNIIDIETNFDYFVYRLNSGNLERIVTDCDESSARTNGSSTVVSNVDSLNFTFKDKYNNTTVTHANACGVDISLTVGKTAVAAAGTRATECLATTIKFRNKEIP
jgi:type II secretory pathway pseudopilin PulG